MLLINRKKNRFEIDLFFEARDNKRPNTFLWVVISITKDSQTINFEYLDNVIDF